MPEYYFLPKRIVRAVPALHGFARGFEGVLIRGYFALLGRLSLAHACRLAYFLFAILGSVISRRRKMVANLAVAFPDKGPAELRRLTRGCFGHMGMAFAELCHLRDIWDERAERLEFVADPTVEVVRGGDRPAVFVTAHVGSWQLGNLLAAEYDIPVTTIYAPESNPAVDEVVRTLRARLPINLLPRDNVVRQLMRELAAGHSIGIAGDTRLDEGDDVPFFGVAAPTNTVPARLALRFDCELVAVSTERLPGNRFRVTVHAPVVPDDPTASILDQALQMTTKLNVQFESWIRRTPDQWACFARRWPRAAGQAALRSRGMTS
jgi:KDO2-lipid IV(A) lauroyltransferase